MSPQGSGTGPAPCSVLGIAESVFSVVLWLWQELIPRHPEVTDLPCCHTNGLSLRLLWSLNFLLGACPYPPPQLAPASPQHQARLNPCAWGHFSPPYLKVITKDGGALCAPPKPCCCPGGSCSPPAVLLSTPAASPGLRQSQAPSLHPLPYLKHCSLGAEFSAMREKDAGKTQLKEV